MQNDEKNTIMFDTLAYSDGLKSAGITHSEVLTTNLSRALTQNIYTKAEVDKMIDQALKEFHERTYAMDKRFEKFSIELKAATEKSIAKWEAKGERTIAELRATNEKSITDLRIEMTKLNNRTITIIVSILSSLTVLMGTIGHLLH